MYKQLLAELGGVSAATLQDAESLMALLRECLDRAGFHIVKAVAHQFDEGGEGFTGVFILSESHMVVHTYPEFGYMAFDLFSCAAAKPQDVLRFVEEALAVPKTVVHEIERSAP